MKFTHLFIIGALAVATAGITGCSKSNQQEAEVTEAEAVEVLPVDSIAANMAAYAGDTVTVSGYCSHLCKHGGKKAFLVNADTTVTLMCVADASLEGGAFAPDCPGKELTVVGVVTPMTASKSELEKVVAAQAAQAGEGHCDTEAKALGGPACWLDSLNKQIEAGGDTTIVTGYYINAISYGVAQ